MLNQRINALRIAARFLKALSLGARPTPEECKLLSDLCFLALPMKYRMSRKELDELQQRVEMNRL